jgi:hypothetical protein
MRYFAVVLLVFLTSLSAKSQTYEIGGLVGGSNYIGDVGKTNYIAPNNFAFGGIFKWNRSARHSFRGSVMIARISGNDSDSGEERRKQRGYSFNNTISEISIGLEFTFFEFNVHSGKPVSTPYLYTGLTYFWYEALYKVGDVIKDYDGASAPAIPMVIGYKATIANKMVLGFEIGARYAFTDDLDGSNPVKGLADNDEFKFGNTNSDDWYVFTGVTLTFSFGRRPCYCNF